MKTRNKTHSTGVKEPRSALHQIQSQPSKPDKPTNKFMVAMPAEKLKTNELKARFNESGYLSLEAAEKGDPIKGDFTFGNLLK